MIITDGIHLTSDESMEELHEFARSVGLKKEWFQKGTIDHYDITTKRKLDLVLSKGVELVGMYMLMYRYYSKFQPDRKNLENIRKRSESNDAYATEMIGSFKLGSRFINCENWI